mmetsp:Transcript_11389/g.11418  ORF Transcript_11389/g.11418 Transcript_11389/m.11418 type:complete len:155 (-) Transcript_11389:68-532(-)
MSRWCNCLFYIFKKISLQFDEDDNYEYVNEYEIDNDRTYCKPFLQSNNNISNNSSSSTSNLKIDNEKCENTNCTDLPTVRSPIELHMCNINENECVICLDPFDMTNPMMPTLCSCGENKACFHYPCLLLWRENTSFCPVCRCTLYYQEVEEENS